MDDLVRLSGTLRYHVNHDDRRGIETWLLQKMKTAIYIFPGVDMVDSGARHISGQDECPKALVIQYISLF